MRPITVISSLALFLLSFTSCKKLIDKIKEHTGGHNGNKKECRISTISFVYSDYNGNGDFVSNITVQYNTAGNPTLVTFPQSADGSVITKYHFRYDMQNRLTDFIATNKENMYGAWHRYACEGQQAVRDTLYEWGGGPNRNIDSLVRPIDPQHPLGVINFNIDYDSEGRIIRDSGYYVIPPHEPENVHLVRPYNYDSSGNLIINPFLEMTYDNKRAMLRTNKVWMFINRNYSKNNPRTAASYNEEDLPLKFEKIPELYNSVQFMDANLREATIEYYCPN